MITDHVVTAIRSKIGHGWGGLGDVAMFVGGVFRNELGGLQTFGYVQCCLQTESLMTWR